MAIDFPPSDPRGRELQLLLERAKYERWLSARVEELLERTWNETLDVLHSAKFRTLTRFQQQRILELAREVDRILKSGYVDVAKLHLKELQGYASLEADVARVQAASVLSPGNIEAVNFSLRVRLPKTYLDAIAKLPIQGRNIGDWFEGQAETMSRESRRIIQQGLVEGKAPAEISRRLLADDRAAGPVLARRSKAEAKMVSRTAVNAVQNDASRQSNMMLPRSISDSYRWVSVHDKRTSPICRALDGRVFKYDDPGALYPPAHISCRSTTLAIVKGAGVSIGEQKTRPLSMRSYGDWLATQPESTQNDILGPSRAALWRGGKSLADMIDADNRVLTLKQLRERLGLGELAGVGAG